MELERARALAESLQAQMAPFCARKPEIVGSVRRENADVGDIELLVIPKWEEKTVGSDLFGTPETAYVNLLHEWAVSDGCAVQWIKPGTSDIIPWVPKAEGRMWKAQLHNGLKLDLFIARGENYGCIQLIRTGSADFSHAIVTHALYQTGLRFAGGQLVNEDTGEALDTPDERTVFDLLGLEYVEPQARVDGGAIRRKIEKGTY